MENILIIGAGGNAKGIVDILVELNPKINILFLENDATKINKFFYGYSVISENTFENDNTYSEYKNFIVGVGATSASQNVIRRKIYNKFTELGLKPITVIHKSCIVSPTTKIGQGTVVMAGAIIQSDAHIGDNVIINTGVQIDHDSKISNHVHICPCATITGDVAVGENVLIGAGATIIQSINIEDSVTVGAGSVVLNDVQKNTAVAGNPAKAI